MRWNGEGSGKGKDLGSSLGIREGWEQGGEFRGNEFCSVSPFQSSLQGKAGKDPPPDPLLNQSNGLQGVFFQTFPNQSEWKSKLTFTLWVPEWEHGSVWFLSLPSYFNLASCICSSMPGEYWKIDFPTIPRFIWKKLCFQIIFDREMDMLFVDGKSVGRLNVMMEKLKKRCSFRIGWVDAFRPLNLI